MQFDSFIYLITSFINISWFIVFYFSVLISPWCIPITQLLYWLTIHPPEKPGYVLQLYEKKQSLYSFIIPLENPICLSFLLIPYIRTFWFKWRAFE